MALFNTSPSYPRERRCFDNGGPSDLPLEAAAEIYQDCFVTSIEIVNIGGVDRVIYCADGDGVPIITSRTLPAGQVETYSAKDGRRMKGGVWWKADGAGCKGYVSGFLL